MSGATPGRPRVLPTHADVLMAVAMLEPVTVIEVARWCADNVPGCPNAWDCRQNVRNRLRDLVAARALITDEARPARFAANDLPTKERP